MSNFISPYDRESGYSETNLALAVILSVAFHLTVAWVFIFVFPILLSHRDQEPDFMTVIITGLEAPPAPAAPADLPVDPNQKGPDVVAAPKGDPVPPPPQLKSVTPDAAPAPPDVIPLGPKAPDKPPEIKKVSPPPKITPPKVEKPKVETPKPKVNPDAEINKRMDALKRKRAAEQLDEDIEARMYNLNLARGRGEGDSSEQSGASGTQKIHPDMARYYRHIRDIISENWVPPTEALATNNQTVYQITIAPGGQITSLQLLRSSGNQNYDLSVQRAINKSNPLPELPPIFGGQPISPRLTFESEELQRVIRQRNRA